MLKLILQRLAQMVLIMAVVSLVLFAVFDSAKFKKQLAVNELGGFASRRSPTPTTSNGSRTRG